MHYGSKTTFIGTDNEKRKTPFSKKCIMYAYDKDSGEIFGRTPSSLAQIGIFYSVFYITLVAIFSIVLWVFFQTLDPRIPTKQLDRSLIGTNPGLGFRPMPNETHSTLIHINSTLTEEYTVWIKRLIDFLEVYKTPGLTPGRGENIATCSYDQPPGKGKVCNVEVRAFDQCTDENRFYYDRQAPCIFLKLNKIYGWNPIFYDDPKELPDEMPEWLKSYIRNITNPNELRTVWVSCDGETVADKELIGPISYNPRPGFPGYFFPFENAEGYLSPLVAVQFKRPHNSIAINVLCKAWAKNIYHNKNGNRGGSAHFELMID
ncbi:sodium/potassium-transporting ATPase subunit beta-2-like [Daktulosphaira vitifoliae]|uniref:sodium/potassium-transporting ATPase subunit beta-2-like n=1 Tax=Daktulosphaira vitifoliae TaxID=58002 RepID=UPI0021A9C437|nr:sodium/potassium-transporting ATPase subunit beta-2-like [Daktulosphaira vitifoliae]